MKKLLSVGLCLSLFITSFFILNVKAVTYPMMGEIASPVGKTTIYTLPGTTGHEASPELKGQSQPIVELINGTLVQVLGVEADRDNDKWYKINYGENFENTGFAIVDRVSLKYEYVYDEDFEQNLLNFPESYHNALRELHAKYPNWKFIANNFDITFKNAVESEYGVENVKDTRKWVEFTYGGNEWRDMRAYDAATDSWAVLESRWTYASRAAIEYYMDPRNSLNENMIFAFMQQSYHEDEKTVENLRTVIKGTFLEAGYDRDGDGIIEVDAYIEDIMAAAQESRVSPYVLAATIIVEQGVSGATNLVSGTYTYSYTNAETGEVLVDDYTGYYNFFNYSATGDTVDAIAISGLTYAKNSGWNSRELAIKGGANKYADGYIAIGQDTYYYKDFNVVKESWNHQYAAALYDAWTNAKYLQKGCIANTEATITFLIPVFAEMPDAPCPIPSVVNPEYVPGPSPESTPEAVPEPAPEPVPEPEPEPVIIKGDTSGDEVINAVDLAAVKMHILEVKYLEGNAVTAADVNNDGAINAVDLATIKMHILGVKLIV